jgi:hypothetical protein
MARPKGYAPWSPAAATLEVLSQVRQVLDDYRDHLPLTVRQIFYRLVGQYDYEKTERAYARLCEYLVRARRAGLVSWTAIRDDGTVSEGGGGYSGETMFWRSVRSSADWYSRDRLHEQPFDIELWCEAAGMVPQLVRVADPYSVPVYSTGGFSSVTVTYEIAQRALGRDRPTLFLHVGDYDPSGESIFTAMTTDAASFLRSKLYDRTRDDDHLYLDRPVEDPTLPDLHPVRVALTAEQVDEYDLPTAPPKSSDTRSRNWHGETCQLEAMPPDELAELVRRTIEDRLDMDIYEQTIATEEEERERIKARVTEFLS